MNQELTTNPFNPLTPPKTFDEIKISLASPQHFNKRQGPIQGFAHGAWALFSD